MTKNTGIASCIEDLLMLIGEDPERGGLKETPKRVEKAWREWTSGYDVSPASVLKTFEDGGESYNQMIIVKDIHIYSHCEHHMAPFFGVAHIAYVPDKRILGLSKFHRLAHIFMRRLQVQERLTNQIAEALWEHLQPKGVGVALECRHMCMESRGIKTPGSTTRTQALFGVFQEDACKQEFFQLIRE